MRLPTGAPPLPLVPLSAAPCLAVPPSGCRCHPGDRCSCCPVCTVNRLHGTAFPALHCTAPITAEQYNELDPAMIASLGDSSFLLRVPRVSVRLGGSSASLPPACTRLLRPHAAAAPPRGWSGHACKPWACSRPALLLPSTLPPSLPASPPFPAPLNRSCSMCGWSRRWRWMCGWMRVPTWSSRAGSAREWDALPAARRAACRCPQAAQCTAGHAIASDW